MSEIVEKQNITSPKKPSKEYNIQTIDEKTSDYWKDYEYWQVKEQLTPWLEVKKEKEVEWANSNSWHKIVSSATVPYDVSVTWIWFKPKTVIINANPAVSWHAVFSNWSATDWSKWNCVYAHDNSNTIFSWTTYSTTKVISLEWYDWANYPDIEVELKSMDSDWFTLTVTRNDQNNSFNFNYTCF